jgi:hypothetical protein
MSLSKHRKFGSGGTNPGLTPIDNIQESNMRPDFDPDPATGRMPGQEDEGDRGTKRRRNNKKSSGRRKG